MARYDKIPMVNYGNLWQIMTKYGKVWQSMAKYDKIWQIIEKYGKIWKSMPIALDGQNQKLPLKIQIWQKRAKICKEMPTKNSKNYQMHENCSKMAKNPKIDHSKAKM